MDGRLKVDTLKAFFQICNASGAQDLHKIEVNFDFRGLNVIYASQIDFLRQFKVYFAVN